jgi:hypothetical protein
MQEKPTTARTRYNIEVTEKDIAKAQRNHSYKCVVSQAIARALPDATRIETDNQTIRFTQNGERLVFLTPYAVQGYVIGFDAGDEIQPFSFQLRNPIRTKRTRLLAAGAEANRARIRARRRVTKKARDLGVPLNAPKVKAAERAAAKAAYAEAIAAQPGGVTVVEGGPEHRRVPPRVFKKKMRTYGHRMLRINQEHAAE